MKPSEQLTEIRRLIGCQSTYQELFVRAQCERIYGSSISKSTWFRWRKKARVESDPSELGGLSTASYVLLLTIARLSVGNNAGRRHQVSVARMVEAARQIIKSDDLPELLPLNSYQQLRELIELQAARTYTDRYHRKNGLKKAQPWYSKAEAIKILQNYPNFNDVQQAS